MTSELRREVLRCFKSLHRTRQDVFRGDTYALSMGRNRINEEFRKNRDVGEPVRIAELVKISKEVEVELRTTVIQARRVSAGTYQAVIKPETVKLDNVPFQDCGGTKRRDVEKKQ